MTPSNRIAETDSLLNGRSQDNYAGGVKLATLTRRATFNPSATHDSVQFHHDDPAGVSQRLTRNYPEALLGQPSYDPNYIDPRQAEFDPMGSNVGLVTNYSPQYLPSDPNQIPIEGESPLYINGQAATVTLDGTRLSGVHLTAYINSGMIGGMMGLTQILMRQSDARFTSVRLRLFDSNRWQNWGSNMHGAIDRASMFSGLHHIRAHINYGFNANFSWGPQAQTQAGKPNAYPLAKLLSDAENIIKNATGKCAELLGKNALAQFQEKKKQYEYDPTNLNVPSASAARTYEDTGNVYLNPLHYVFNPDSRSIVPIPKGISKRDREFYERRNATPEFWAKEIKNAGVNEYSYAVGAILHEFLHQIGEFEAHTAGTSESVKDQREVIKKCIKGNEPK